MAGKMKTSNVLRWIHFAFGLSISAYFILLPAEGGHSSTVNNIYRTAVIGIVFWTGVIRWNLPRIRRWRAQRAAAQG